MHAFDPPRLRSLALALTAALALTPACGDGGTAPTTGTGTTADETTGTTAAATTDDPTTGPVTTTGTGTTTGTSTGDPAVCDGSMAANTFACQACTECGTWTNPVAGPDYPPAMVCMFEGLRDDRVVGAINDSGCSMGKCLSDRLLSTGMGTVISQQLIFDENDQSMQYLSIQELEFNDPAFFEACLAAYDVNCTSPNTWFQGLSTNVTDLVCP